MSDFLYIIFFRWQNTASNHAGMAYLSKALKDELPNQIKLIEIHSGINSWPRIIQRFYFVVFLWILKIRINQNDKLLFMEYLGNRSGNQAGMVMKLRAMGIKNEISGLVHLPGDTLLELYADSDYIKTAVASVDKILTFGTSLTSFFSQLGFREKTFTTFHYVDTDFYHPAISHNTSDKLHVIHVGSLKRNFIRLKNIVALNHNIQFHICQGNKDLSKIFADEGNVILYGFLDEIELRRLMQACQVSLSILEDTVGSNVITTSFACGLVNVVSDVGSIRDYCTDSNSVLCQTDQDFTNAIQQLDKDRELLKELKKNALETAKDFSLDKFKKEFEKMFFG